MASRAERLRSEIESAKRDLAHDFAELKVEAAATRRRMVTIVAAVVGAYAIYRIARFAWRRRPS